MVIDHDGRRLLSRRVASDEQALLALLQLVAELAEGAQVRVTWAADQTDGVPRC